MRQRRLVLLAGVLVTAAGVALYRSLGTTRSSIAALSTCTSASAQDWEGALAASAALPKSGPADPTLLDTVDCRCAALEATGAPQSCDVLLDDWLLRPGADGWLPPEPRLLRWMGHAAGQGRIGDVALVAERRRRATPEDPLWTYRAFAAALRTGDETRVYGELSALLPGIHGEAELRARSLLSENASARGDHAEAFRVLGAREPASDDPDLSGYFQRLMLEAANNGVLADVQSVRDRWLEVGGDPAVVACSYADALSVTSLPDPAGKWPELLTAAVAMPGSEKDPAMLGNCYKRLIGHLTVDGDAAEALKVHDEAKRRLPDFDMATDELARIAARQAGDAEGEGELRFEVPNAPAEASLWVSPDRGHTGESRWTEVPLAGGGASVERGLAATPIRWVLRSESETFASGTTWPAPGSDVRIPVTVGPGKARAVVNDLAPGRPADGHRRVWVVILDCGDWRLTSYLRQRGELPNFDALLRTGWRATPLQWPAFTAAAMDAISHPVPKTSATVLARVHELGIELAGLSSIGKNPFAPLEFVLPAQKGLFDTLGAGDLRVANLLFSHGAISAGRNAEVSGPNGAHSVLPLGKSDRPLSADENAAFPELQSGGVYKEAASTVRVMAAQFDTMVHLLQGEETDSMFFRVEGLDPATHGGFAATAMPAQDDGKATLFTIYRYIDRRLGDVARALDGDDMLIVMSDHGIETSMLHHPVALFVAWGNGVPTGQVVGRPAVRGVSRAVADALGVETDWPDYGLLPWTKAWRAGEVIAGGSVPSREPTVATAGTEGAQ